MTGGLMQLVGKGAQDQLLTGNPSFTHFRSVYKRHTDFAMEHFRLYFRSKNLSLPPSGSLTLRTKVERYAQLVHDCYLSVTIPDIYSTVYPIVQTVPPTVFPHVNPSATAIGYEFQWVHNLGYNMINYVSILVNGQEIVKHTGEWMKLYAELTFNAAKKAVLNQLVGNTVDLYDPANAYDRMNQYPHAISSFAGLAAPSIPGRTLTIPLHFWFCESIGSALPLIALQHSEVEIIVELKNMYQLFTTLDVRSTINGSVNPNFGLRVAPDASVPQFTMTNFLSPPLFNPNPGPPIPNNTSLIQWKLDPFIEANYIFVTDAELAHIASTDHSFLITQIDFVSALGQYGPSNDLELVMKNLCTRVVWVAQRSDRTLQNDYDNYTNWVDPFKPPLDTSTIIFMTPSFSSGNAQSSAISQRDILLESSIILDGKERFNPKQTEFFSNIQNYKFSTGLTISDIPGIYSYSFALQHSNTQPTGSINGSQFNKTVLRNTYVQPPYSTSGTFQQVCVLKSTANSKHQVIVNPALYSPDEVVTIVRKSDSNVLQYSYNVHAYVESYNFLRVLGGIANVVFSS
jgi:hypothetical protein